MQYARRFLWGLTLLLSFAARGEIYQGIGPLDDLGDLKEMFPGANFERLSPAWAQEHDVLYQITGRGLSGTIVVKFYDVRPSWRKEAESETDADQKAFLEEMANEPDDSISVEWVRWLPDTPIPVQRFVSKYGSPEERGFSDSDLQPYRHWKAKGLTAFLTDDEKQVVRVDYEFTVPEQCTAWREQRGRIPPWLANDCVNPKPTVKPPQKAPAKKP